MKRVAEDEEERSSGKRPSVVRFFGGKKSETGFLSNFFDSPIVIDGVEWPTAEAYYQAGKFTSESHRERIRNASTAYKAKNLGNLKRGRWPDKYVDGAIALARQEGVTMRVDWEDIKEQVMERALVAKFTQHKELASRLAATWPAVLEEASPYDSYWGTGRTGTGRNRLGHLLMKVRAQFLK